jgi:hypothetical protein
VAEMSFTSFDLALEEYGRVAEMWSNIIEQSLQNTLNEV